MEDPEIIPIADARHLSVDTAAAEIRCVDTLRIGEATEVGTVEARGAKDCGGKNQCWDESSQLCESGPV
jgi:hypothetical protein